MDWGEYVAKGIRLRKQSDSHHWELGDLALEVETTYGEDSLSRFADEIGVAAGSLRRYRMTAGAFESVRRRTNLTFSHHAEAASIRDEGHRELIIWQAEVEGWSSSKIREEAAAWKKENEYGEDDLGHTVAHAVAELPPAQRKVLKAVLKAHREERPVTAHDLDREVHYNAHREVTRLKKQGLIGYGPVVVPDTGKPAPSLRIITEGESHVEDLDLYSDSYEPEGTKAEDVWDLLYAIESLASMERSPQELWDDLHENQQWRIDRDLSKAYQLISGLRSVYQENVVSA